MKTNRVLFALVTLIIIGIVVCNLRTRMSRLMTSEIIAIGALSIGSLPPLSPDPSNQYADDPRAITLGHKLFFDTRFSANGKIACATCHVPELNFQDGLPLAQGIGTTTRRTMTITGSAYSPWLFWDGRKDSLWAQALGPLESLVEHGGNRTYYAHLIDKYYRAEYEAIFGSMADLRRLPRNAGPCANSQAKSAWEAMATEDREAVTRIFANLGKAIAAYERLIRPGPSRFDAYTLALMEGDAAAMQAAFSVDEAAGLRLFIGKAECIKCHNGPLFTDNYFHNTGVPTVAGLPIDTGRAQGAPQVLADEFNCLSSYSDADKSKCTELKVMIAEGQELIGQFKTPSLRNVAERSPYMHAGQFATLEEVLAHYNAAPIATNGASELEPLYLNEAEIKEIIAFLKTLNGQNVAGQQWLQAPK